MVALVLATCALAACELAHGSGAQLGDSDASTPRAGAGSSSCSFAATTTFALPLVSAATSPFARGSGRVPCPSGDGTYDFGLVDMTGDLAEDLLVTRSCDDPSVRPSSAWLVYPNTGSGFGAPSRFVLPMLGAAPSCFAEALVDVDGDRRPDLLLTSSCLDASVGTSHWIVYRNTATGFDLTPRSFALPPAGAAGTFAPRVFASLVHDSASCGAGPQSRPAYAFVDLTGDLKPDLVLTTACDDPNVGVSRWRVYPSDGAGLGAAIDFALPPGQRFATPLAGEASCRPAFSSPRYFVVDFDGDFAPDLIVTKSCQDSNVGLRDWLVYPSSGSSFAATPQLVPLPQRGSTSSAPFEELDQSVACANGATLSHALVDVDGDFKPDLVLTRDCLDAAVGATHWLVLRNGGSAFGAPAPYALPTLLGAPSGAPVGLDGTLRCDASSVSSAFRAEHFLGQELDLLVTASCSDATLGATRWLVQRPSCAPPPP